MEFVFENVVYQGTDPSVAKLVQQDQQHVCWNACLVSVLNSIAGREVINKARVGRITNSHLFNKKTLSHTEFFESVSMVLGAKDLGLGKMFMT